MSTTINNLSLQDLPSAWDMRVGIIVCEWNSQITNTLLNATVSTLQQHGAKTEHILVRTVPGSFELVFAANRMVKSGLVDGVIVLGCIIRGDTPHFDFIAQGCTNGIAQLNASGDIPVIFGVLTTNTLEQAQQRAGGTLGNKGEEYAITAIKMIDYARSYER